ncbi:MAG: hypothetical protein JNL10_07340 [Verrucomicrobiales bacterium]|nr:hypothetical protein [Verrucomicrobiales bacterium]
MKNAFPAESAENNHDCPKSVVALPDGRLAIATFPKPDDTRDIAAGENLAMTLAAARLLTAGEQP